MCRAFVGCAPAEREREKWLEVSEFAKKKRGLRVGDRNMGEKEEEGSCYLDFEKVFGWAVDFFVALLAGVWQGLHFGKLNVVCSWDEMVDRIDRL